MTLTAEVVGFLKTYQLAVGESKLISVIRVVAVEAPPAGHVFEHDILMHLFKFSWPSVNRHALVALRARKYSGRERGRRNKELFGDFLFFGDDNRGGYNNRHKRCKREKPSCLFSIHIISPLYRYGF
jgi:hypothetical protein